MSVGNSRPLTGYASEERRRRCRSRHQNARARGDFPVADRLYTRQYPDHALTLEDTLSDRKYPAPTSSNQQVKKLLKIVQDVEKASRALPEEEREAYRSAQQSVVNARRRAELQEGLLQVN